MAAPPCDFCHSRCRAPDGAVVLYSKVCYAKVLALLSTSALQQSASWGAQGHLAAESQSAEVCENYKNKQPANSWGLGFLFVCFQRQINSFTYFTQKFPSRSWISSQCNCNTLNLIYTGTKRGQTQLSNLDKTLPKHPLSQTHGLRTSLTCFLHT